MGNFFQKITEICGCRKKHTSANRTVHVNHKYPVGEEVYVPETFISNRVISSKYTAWNFLPKNLFEQFQRIANFYFLCVGFIELIIDSPVSPIASLLPLGFVITVTAFKQGYEDILRHRADNEVNHRQTQVLRDGEIQQIKSMDIEVGDIVRVSSNEGIPADMVMLSSHDPDGECYITTANLDGETNLKTFGCLPDTRRLQNIESLSELQATIECQQPITDLYRFVGNMTVLCKEEGNKEIVRSLGHENVLLRGSRLKNTPYIFGCAVYTGQETKISLNSKYKTTKFSQVERAMNTFLIVLLLVLVTEAALLTGLKHWYYSDPAHSPPIVWYAISESTLSAAVVVEEFLSFMVILNYIIPISMYVTVELQKFIGSMFFQWDLEMYDAQSNETAKANTSDLNEELGQVQYLFTDKTGTLTENDMQFRQCSVGGVKYIEVGGLLCKKPDIPGVQPMPLPKIEDELEDLLTVLSLCHTVRVDKKDNDVTGGYSENGFDYEYQSSSPDEKALVEACRRYGVVYHGPRDDRVEVTFKGRRQCFTIHHTLDFDPTRKRMSILLENEKGEAMLLCKGAETAILDRVIKGDTETVEKHITDYARLGLRTLVVAMRKLTVEEFQQLNTLLTDARTALDDRVGKLEQAFDIVERDLTLVGATAVEDKLQDGVPETITALRQAGIQVWVLTGDKEETAVNISYSAGHFPPETVELRLTQQESSDSCARVLEELKGILSNARDGGEEHHALIIDGRSLALALDAHSLLLQSVCKLAITVLCCRMSPLQKAMVVRLVKKSKKCPTTAAIGDGANDVSMIQEAHVGLGIMGKEGRQAVRSSDYAFGRFRFLKRALLVHGHYFYIRLAMLVQYFFFKNVAFITAQLYFCFFSAFSAQSIYETFFLTLFNITFTSLPILIYGWFEIHIPADLLMNRPELYKSIRNNARLTIGKFLMWNSLAVYHSLVSFFGVYFLFYWDSSLFSDGKMLGVYEFGALVYTVCVIAVNIKLMLETYTWNGFVFAAYAVTFIGYFSSAIAYSVIYWPSWLSDNHIFGAMLQLWSSPTVWLGILLLVVVAIIPDILLRGSRDSFTAVYRLRSNRKKTKSFAPVELHNMTLCGSRPYTISVSSLLNDDSIDTGS